MRLEQLQYFIEIAHTKSISIAAEHLYVTQPALSRAIKALEDELGVILFTRTVEGAFLTKEGETLLPEILEILQKNRTFAKSCCATFQSHPTQTCYQITHSNIIYTGRYALCACYYPAAAKVSGHHDYHFQFKIKFFL